MWNKGWDEYNGGNVSYRLTEDEVKTLANDLAKTPYSCYPDNRIETEVLEVPKQYILITASESHFRTLCL